MTDIARLQLRIDSVEAELASRRLNDLKSKAGGAEKATSGLTGAFSKLLGPITAVVSATAALGKLVEVQRQFDVLNAGLITATGSSEKASVAFEALQEFASKTPYDLAQVTESFTKLVNLGLNPSERALNSYGNTASAMGKSMNQLIEAVADAATGEFERLKEFGIKAKQEGDKVSLTFRGTTTQIGNNAAEIESYLMKLGEVEFAGSMQQRMDTLDGALSNLSDTWDMVFLNISKSGIGDIIEESVKMATDALTELNAMLASGELEGYLTAIGGKFEGFGKDAGESIEILTALIKENFGEWEDEGQSTVSFLVDAFKNFPENIRAFVKLAAVEFANHLEMMKASASFWHDAVLAIFNDDTIDAAMKRYTQRVQGLAEARTSSISDIIGERDAALNSFNSQMEASKKLREEYDKQQEAKKKANVGTDRLSQFGINKPKASAGVDKAAQKAADAEAKRQQKEFESLVASLRTEEEAVAESYAKRKAIIEANTASGSGQRSDLLARLDKDHAEQLKKIQEQRDAEVDSLRQQMATEEESIQASYDKRMQIISEARNLDESGRAELEGRVAQDREKALADLDAQRQQQRDQLYNGLLTEEEMLKQSYERKKTQIMESESVTELERQDLLRRLKKQFDDETEAAETKRIQTQLGNASSLFGGLADLAKTYGGEQSKAYKALFAVSKAFSITQAVMSIATGIAKAQELGFPANLAAMAQVAAQGASALSTIRGSNYSGAYDEGGQIPAGKIGIVGEYGPELVKGPGTVTGRKATERMANEAQGGSSGAPALGRNLRIVNAFDTSVVGDYMGSDDGEEIIMNAVRRNQSTIRSMASGG